MGDLEEDMNDQERSQASPKQWQSNGDPLKIYIAGRYDHLELFREYKLLLEEVGFVVTSRWLSGEHAFVARDDDEIKSTYDNVGIRSKYVHMCGDWGNVDTEDVIEADVLLFFGEMLSTPARRGGRMVELGIAIGWNQLVEKMVEFGIYTPSWKKKLIVVVGPRENNFSCLPNIRQTLTFPEAVAMLKVYRDGLAS